MDASLLQIAVDPQIVFSFCLFAGGGVALGTASGLVPGLHANNFALLLAATAASIPADPLFVGVAMLTAGVVHTFLDIVPMLTLGVPDAAMAISALPGHRLVLEGRGREALRLSAVGSGLAVAVALPLAVPITWAMTHAYPFIRAQSLDRARSRRLSARRDRIVDRGDGRWTGIVRARRSTGLGDS